MKTKKVQRFFKRVKKEDIEIKRLLSEERSLPPVIKEEANILFDLGWDIPEIEKMIYFRTRKI
jgi:hypothetical protein